jgi:Mechanosensitive ion channel, conserved TM helix
MTGRSIVTPLENLWNRIGEFLPNFLAAFVLLVIGVAIALGVRFLVIKLLNSIGWEKLARKTPALRILEVGDIRYPFFALVGAIVFWVVILVFIGTAARSLGLSSVELLIDHFVAFLPNLFLAVVIVALGAWVGGLAGKFARAFAMAARIQEANLLGKGVQYLVIVIALGTALEQLNVATRFLFGAFLIVLGSLGLAFGLGGQVKAREIIERISRVEEEERPTPAETSRTAVDSKKGEP